MKWQGKLKWATRSSWILLFRRWWPGRAENILFSFCSVPPLAPQPVVTKKKRAVSFSSGSQEGKDGSERRAASTPPSPSPFTSGQKGPVRGRNAFSRAPCPAVEPGKCHSAHSDPTSERTFLVGSLCSTLLPHCEYVGGSSRAWLALWLLRTIRLGYAIQFARCPPKFRGIQFTSVLNKDAPVLHAEIAVLLAKDMIEPVPPAEMKSGFYSPYLILPMTNLGLVHPEPGPSQAPVLDVDAETQLSMHSSLWLVRSDRPEGRVLSCLDPSSTQTVSLLCVWQASISVQSPSLRAVPVASCLHQGSGGSPHSFKGKRNFAFLTILMTGSYWPSLKHNCANTGTRCSVT